IGLAMSGMIMRVGQSAESFAWAAVFILMPVSGVYYPISVLPHWLQVCAQALPTAYVFEGMRAIMEEKTVHWQLLAFAFALSAVYLVVGFQVFQWFFRSSRRAGTLLGQGEGLPGGIDDENREGCQRAIAGGGGMRQPANPTQSARVVGELPLPLRP